MTHHYTNPTMKELLKHTKQTLRYIKITLIKIGVLNVILMIIFNLMFIKADDPVEQGLGLLALIISLTGLCLGWAKVNKMFPSPPKTILEGVTGTILVIGNILFLMYYSFGLITWQHDLWGYALFGIGFLVTLITNLEIVKI